MASSMSLAAGFEPVAPAKVGAELTSEPLEVDVEDAGGGGGSWRMRRI